MLARRLSAADAHLDVLDGGCGTGLAGPMLRPYARQLTGVDLSPAMLDRARKTGIYDTLVESELGSFLAAHAESFDVCVFVDVLIYFGDLRAILASAARSLSRMQSTVAVTATAIVALACPMTVPRWRISGVGLCSIAPRRSDVPSIGAHRTQAIFCEHEDPCARPGGHPHRGRRRTPEPRPDMGRHLRK